MFVRFYKNPVKIDNPLRRRGGIMEARKGISRKFFLRFLTKGLRIPSGAEP